MTLADWQIVHDVKAGIIGIDPYYDKFVQPASYDVHLSRWFRAFKESRTIDIALEGEHTALFERECIDIVPGEFLLGSTMERVSLPGTTRASLEGKSSVGRLGVAVHVTAGFVDPGFAGHITLEIVNFNRCPVRLYAGMPIAQLSFQRMDAAVGKPYGQVAGSKYQYQEEAPVESQFWKNFPDKILETS